MRVAHAALHSYTVIQLKFKDFCDRGYDRERADTQALGIRKPMLYPAELRGQSTVFELGDCLRLSCRFGRAADWLRSLSRFGVVAHAGYRPGTLGTTSCSPVRIQAFASALRDNSVFGGEWSRALGQRPQMAGVSGSTDHR